jgi:hypothetical protein
MRIPQTNTVIEFEFAENLLLLIGGALKDFQNKNNAKVQFLNVPQNIPPDAPRIIISSRNAIINISLTRFEIISKIPSHIIDDVAATLLFTKKNVEDTVDQLWAPELKYSWLGLVTSIDYPKNSSDKTALQLAIPFFDKLINVDRKNRELGSFEVKFGFKEGNYNKNYKISCFETRDIKIDPTKLSSLQKVIDLEEFSAITNAGLRIIFDINNKKSELNNTFKTDFEGLLLELESSLKYVTAELNLEDLL